MINSKTMRESLRKLPGEYAGLLVMALVLGIISIFTNLYFGDSKSKTFAADLQRQIQRNELSFQTLEKRFREQKDSTDTYFRKYYNNNRVNPGYLIFIYSKDSSGTAQINFWNANTVLPNRSILQSPHGSGFAQLPNGYYAWNKKAFANKVFVALFPVKWEFVVSNDYLDNDFQIENGSGTKYEISYSTGVPVKSVYGNELFKIKDKENGNSKGNHPITILLRIMSCILVFIWLHNLSRYLIERGEAAWPVFLLQLSVITVFRLSNIYLDLPFDFSQFEIFDPQKFGGFLFSQSLGDLALNIVFFTWPLIFWWIYFEEKKILLVVKNDKMRWVYLTIFSGIIVGATFVLAGILKQMVTNIPFDVMNAFSLNWSTLLAFLVLCCATICYYLIVELLVGLLKPYFEKYFLYIYPVISFIALAYLSFRVGSLSGGFDLLVVLWLLLFVFLIITQRIETINKNFSGFGMVFWMLFFSASITFLIIRQNRDKELKLRQVYARTLSAKEDNSNELLVKTMLTDFRPGYISDNFRRFSNVSDNRHFRDSLLQNSFSGFTNKFRTEIFVFDSRENALNNREQISYNQLNSIFQTQAKQTQTPGLYYYDESYDQFSYITRQAIKTENDSLQGYVFLVVNPRMGKRQNVYPELFGIGEVNSIENDEDYAFAVYRNNRLTRSHNDYPFATHLATPDFAGQPYLVKGNNRFRELWYNAGFNNFVVIVKKQNLFLEAFTLFSYLFCGFLLIALIIWLVNIILQAGNSWQRLRDLLQLSLRQQIHGTVIVVSLISFVVIGLATILFFVNRYELANKERMSEVIKIMSGELEEQITDSVSLGKSLDVNDTSLLKIERLVSQISSIHGLDVNLYDSTGRLKVSSLPLPYVKGIISTQMEPKAFYHLAYQHQMHYFQRENVGKLEFLNSYIPVANHSYLSVPYFTSEANLRKEISNFIIIIINLNAFIFIIAGIISYIITHRITNSLKVIGEKMKNIDISKTNIPLLWTRKDEIGLLVSQYNKMLNKLNESAAELAKVEREGAWSEMARQVAHEIKNPLTPMKLSLQFLQRAMDNNSPNLQELTKSVSKTMIEQIEHLNTIASEFSQFANIEHVKTEKMDLTEALESIRALHHSNSDVTFHWNIAGGRKIIEANKTQVNRVFTNLILNSLQAVEGKRPHLSIDLNDEGKYYEVSVADNGPGIPEEVSRKIFTPNFTTKSSGTGLGLAMSKRIVERSGGKIYFETELGKGTIFRVQWPKLAVG